MFDAWNEVVFLIDEGGNEFRGVHGPRAHCHELPSSVGEVVLHELLGVVDGADRRDAEGAEMRSDE